MIRKIALLILVTVFISGCDKSKNEMKKVLFLHHSTGWNVWLGKTHRYVYKLTGKSDLGSAIKYYAKQDNLNCSVTERFFPKASPYGWKNYPFDYYNIWVKHAGNAPYMEEPTLEILTADYDLIIFKHCFPGSNIQPDTGTPDIDSEIKSLENYKLQYNALKEKMHEFAHTKFIIWTPAAQVENRTTPEEAERASQFYNWVINEWDIMGDNIFVWDFYKQETEGGLYMQEKKASGLNDSHPNIEFSAKAAQSLGKFIVDILENRIK